MEFASDLGKLQRLMASSSAGTSQRQAVLETLSISADDQIMDVGCGGGHLLEHLAKAVGEKGHVYGVDPSEDQIAQARDKCSDFENVSLLNSNADDISLEQNSCNSITSTQAFEYIKDIDAALHEATRILISGGAFVNISILWDHFKFFGAEEKLNNRIHDTFRAHCSHQMLPMELPGKLARLGYRDIRNKSLAFVITQRDQNSPARYTEETVAFFALNQGMSKTDVMDWRAQLSKAEEDGRFGFTSFPVLTSAFPSKPDTPTAVRACQPLIPKSAMNNSVAQLITAGLCAKPEWQFTNPPNRKMTSTRSKLPSQALRKR